jgi:hypothetical protein
MPRLFCACAFPCRSLASHAVQYLFRRHTEELYCLCKVQFHAQATVVEASQCILTTRVSLVRSHLVPLGSFGVVNLLTQALLEKLS